MPFKSATFVAVFQYVCKTVKLILVKNYKWIAGGSFICKSTPLLNCYLHINGWPVVKWCMFAATSTCVAKLKASDFNRE